MTHVGMKESEMKEIALLMKRLALDTEKPEKIKSCVEEMRRNYAKVQYCFD
jgi:glycine hydroxymethyltransferase